MLYQNIAGAEIEGLSLASEQEGPTIVHLLQGEMDHFTSPKEWDATQPANGLRPSKVVVDLGGVSFMDAGGINFLHRTHGNVRNTGGEMIVRNASDRARELFEIVGLSEYFVLDPVKTK